MYPFLRIGSFYISLKELLFIFAFIVGTALAAKKGLQIGIKREIVVKLGIYIFFSSIIGGRFFYVFQNLDWYIIHPLKIVFSKAGFVFYGGFFLSFIVSILYLKKYRVSITLFGDIVAPPLAISEAIGRIGCFLSGCCYGKPTSLPWGISFPLSSVAGEHFGNLPLHPTQLYFSLAGIVIFLFIRNINPSFKGKAFLLYLFLHSFFRFVIEFFRQDSPFIFLNLTTSQVIAIFIGIVGSSLLFFKNRQIVLCKDTEKE